MPLLPRPEVLGIEPYTPGVSKLPGVNRVIKLSSNEGAYGPPPGALRALQAIAGDFHRYPDGGTHVEPAIMPKIRGRRLDVKLIAAARARPKIGR